MIRGALQHPRFAGAADAFIATAENWDALFLKDFQDRLVRCYLESNPGTLAHHLKLIERFSGFLCGGRLGGEPFD